ncbi:MAG: hypothetical protein LBV41_12395 [Cytophagaceae bacterium]|nr:hypothetical protein [Cytophagaceae bacterium]
MGAIFSFAFPTPSVAASSACFESSQRGLVIQHLIDGNSRRSVVLHVHLYRYQDAGLLYEVAQQQQGTFPSLATR